MSVTITASDVNKLRTITGAGMMDCKNALVEANGDFDEAITILRKKGQKVAAKRADNTTSEGIILTHINAAGNNGILLAFACETEPVSKTEDFRNLAAAILDVAVAHNPATTEALLALNMPQGHTVNDTITELIGKIGEKLVIAAYINMSAEQIVSYIHSNQKLAVLVALNQNSDIAVNAGKDVAMQIAAMNPVAVDKDDVDPTVVEKEIEIGKEQARQEGKPENILEKIALGRLNKFYQENTLLNQQFVKDNSLTIAQMLDKESKGLTVKQFKRISLS